MSGLSVDSIVRVSVNLAPQAAARRNFGVLMMVGASPVIDVGERIRTYTDIDGVAADFGVEAPEYKASALFFSQTPRPSVLAVGRWAKTATAGLLKGGVLTSAEQVLSTWTAITAGGFKVTVDGVVKSVSGVNFSGVTNLNGVASAINAVLTGATVTWTGERFVIASATTGVASSIGYAVAPATGTDISTLLKLTQDTALAPVAGIAAETPLDCAVHLADLSAEWYGLMFADSGITDDQHLAVAQFIQAAAPSRIYGATVTDTRVLDKDFTTDLASRLKDLGLTRSFAQYAQNPFAVASFFGRAFTVDFNANRSTITMKFKQEPGIVPERLGATQAATLKAKRGNVFVAYQNDTAIVQEGVMSGPAFFDEIHGLDWLQNAIQTDVWNMLYQSKTKVPQTDAGVNQIITTIENTLSQAAANGLVAPGTWTSDGFGQLERGQFLPKGFYVYAQPMALQAQAEREARKAPPIQVAVKLAGAVHFVDVAIDVNR